MLIIMNFCLFVSVRPPIIVRRFTPSKCFIGFLMKFEGIYFFKTLKSDLRIKSYDHFKFKFCLTSRTYSDLSQLLTTKYKDGPIKLRLQEGNR